MVVLMLIPSSKSTAYMSYLKIDGVSAPAMELPRTTELPVAYMKSFDWRKQVRVCLAEVV